MAEQKPDPKAPETDAPKTPTPTPAPKPAPAPRTETPDETTPEDEQAKQDELAKKVTPDRATIEAAGAGGLLPNYGLSAAPSLNTGTNDVTTTATGHMLLAQSREAAGQPYTPPVAAAPPAAPAARSYSTASEDDGEDEEPAAVMEPIPGPGQTERGWSAEVTARHPAVEAATIEEMLAAVGGPTATPSGVSTMSEGIDPTDSAALQAALSENGFHEQRKIAFRHQAHRIATERLQAASATRAMTSPHGIAALTELAEEMRASADL